MTDHFPEREARALLSPLLGVGGAVEVCKVAQLHPTTVRLWLAGHRTLSLDARVRLAEACGATVVVSVSLPILGHSDAKEEPSGGA